MRAARCFALAPLLFACAASRSPPSDGVAIAPPLHIGPLTDYVPAAGLRWLVIARPRSLLAEHDWRKALGYLVPNERIAQFARGSGIDLRRVSQAVVAGYALGVLYVVRSDGRAARAEQRFVARALHGVKVERPHPDVVRISAVIGATPQTLLRIGSDIVAISVGDSLPIRAAEGFALERLKRSVPVFRGAALASLADYEPDAPLRLFAAGPFDEPWTGAALGLLGAATAVGAGISPAGNARLHARFLVAGDFADGAGIDAPLSRLAQTWHAVSDSSFGHLLGLDESLEGPRLAATEQGLSLDVVVDAIPLAQGLHAATAGGVKEILGGLGTAPKEPGPPVENRSHP